MCMPSVSEITKRPQKKTGTKYFIGIILLVHPTRIKSPVASLTNRLLTLTVPVTAIDALRHFETG